MISAIFFAFWRILEIITLIIIIGLLSWFVDGYVKANALTPNFILILFIVSVLACAWAFFTLFSYHRSSTNAQFVGVVDLLFVGAFIAAVYFLGFIARADCTQITRGEYYSYGLGSFVQVSGQGISVSTDRPCAMLKAAFAFGIMNCIFFFVTSMLAFLHGGRMSSKEDKYYHSSRHSHRRGSSRHSRHSRRSSHSHSRTYV
ncbi:hypothetical protein GGTG_00914 [Gaeumannomyces tritici R3-111a-1]|uniref:MARVEL domain-containing protein n=1 Tax=Gaeumannomyces tritici (strain R3-111a-1) TaxID=644352 RepID=J3NI30_GAET3|nr:hypothetical protein GGTG_00914 [Gaeumannomyces tritici R3-111a-1]EJT80923.1 hypothetical protein GGTG_00914 [Gaeumannomyces tritici R3-111a-1]